jgi:hypothetical protein
MRWRRSCRVGGEVAELEEKIEELEARDRK